MLEFVVFISGALVMVLEMVGARVMAPHLGTSVIVWTSLIGVVLACLASGAWIGGRLADKKLSFAVLARILAGTAAGCALTAIAHPFVGSVVTGLIGDPRIAAVLAAVCLFALPATLFGMISPYIIRLRLADIATSGATVGRLYALSTAGSIIGTFLGGFVLVSWFPSTQILLGTGFCMLLLSLLICRKKPAQQLVLLALFGVLFWGTGAYTQWLVAQGRAMPIETPYNNIQILEGVDNGKRVRVMSTGPGYMQSGMYLDDPNALYFAYTRYYALGTALYPKAHDVLMLGGGGYSVPKWLLAGHGGLDSQHLRLHVVEIDPGMTEAAHKYFALPKDPRMTVTHEDARRFLNANTKQHDLVFVDVFNSHYSVPFHMGTVEAAAALRRAVRDDGAVLMNIISGVDGKTAPLFRSIYASLCSAFEKVYVFAVYPGTPRTNVQNLMVLALPTTQQDIDAILCKGMGHWSANVANIIASQIEITPENDPVPPLTDELAPVERYTQVLVKS